MRQSVNFRNCVVHIVIIVIVVNAESLSLKKIIMLEQLLDFNPLSQSYALCLLALPNTTRHCLPCSQHFLVPELQLVPRASVIELLLQLLLTEGQVSWIHRAISDPRSGSA